MSFVQTTETLLETYMDQQGMHCMEGDRGVEYLCQIAGALGYKDPLYFGQLSATASIGDLLCMLKDNSGMIEAMVEWIKSKNYAEFRDPLKLLVADERAVDMYDEGLCPDCGDPIDPSAVHGDTCPNCKHAFVWGDDDDLSDPELADAANNHGVPL